MSAPLPYRWYLLRHAQPCIADGICYGWHNIPAEGPASQTAANVFTQHWNATHAGQKNRIRLISSPLLRCQQLTRALLPLLAATNSRIEKLVNPMLAEMHFGAWEGCAWDALPQQVWVDWQADFAHYQPGDGESTAQFLQRVHTAAQSTAQWLQHNEKNIAIWITHAGVMRALHWLQRHGNALPAAACQWPQEGACDYGQWLGLDTHNIQALSITAA